MNGLYIAFIGPSGNGKSTQFGLLKSFLVQKYSQYTQDFDFTKEPGGTLYADDIAKRLKFWSLAPEIEMQGFADARANSLANRIRPNLREGKLEVCDRCFLDSLAYQGFGRGLGLETVWDHNKDIVKDIVPDIIVFLDVDLKTALQRSGRDKPDKFDRENAAFWSDVHRGYEETLVWLEKNFPSTRIIRIEDKLGRLSEGETFGILLHELLPDIERWMETKQPLVVREVAR